MNTDYPNGANTPVFDEEKVFMRPNYMVIDLDTSEEPYFHTTKEEVVDHIKAIIEAVMPDDPERYLHNVHVYDLNTTNKVHFKTNVRVDVNFE